MSSMNAMINWLIPMPKHIAGWMLNAMAKVHPEKKANVAKYPIRVFESSGNLQMKFKY